MSYTIGKLAKQADVNIETIRYYQRISLLIIPESKQGYRLYDASDLERLQFIKRAKQAGLQLNEIAELLSLESTQDKQKIRELISSRRQEIEQRIQELQHLNQRLSTLLHDCEASQQSLCPILQALHHDTKSTTH